MAVDRRTPLKAAPMRDATEPAKTALRQDGSPTEVLWAFLKLGLTSFGGPIAHLGYFREEFVVRRRWLDEQAFTGLAALCQFLPGPASSQVGFAIGLKRAGFTGALAAWTGFTLPSALALVLFAYGAGALGGPTGAGLLHGLKLVAVSIVAQAVWGMARTLCPDRERATIALAATLIILFSASPAAQIGAIALGGFAGLWLCRHEASVSSGHLEIPVPRRTGILALAVFLLILIGLPVLRDFAHSEGLAFFDAFYRSGALVFGGGHVGASAAAGSLRDAGLGQRRRFPGWLWRSPSRARAAVHVRSLPGCHCKPWAAWACRCCLGPCWHISPRHADPHGCTALLGVLPEARLCASSDAGRKRRSSGPAWSGSLQPRLDQFREDGSRFWHCINMLRSSHRLAPSAAGRRPYQRGGRNRSCPFLTSRSRNWRSVSGVSPGVPN